MIVPGASPAPSAPVADPFATFGAGVIPPPGVQLGTPLAPAPIGGMSPLPVLDGPLLNSPSAQTPLGGNGNPLAPTAPGGADYPPFTNDATGRIGDTPYRRVKSPGLKPLPSVTPRPPIQLPPGMRAVGGGAGGVNQPNWVP